jgi:micrococcal nuclease
MPSVLHRQTEDRRLWRPGGQVPPPLREKQVTHYTDAISRGKGVSLWNTPFAFWCRLLAFLLCCCSTTVSATDCPASQTRERVEVAHVYDGDTVKLVDGRHLRFIGINTPEIGHHGQANQALATQARSFLDELLNAHNRILNLQPGREEHDHYGRQLAHAFLEDGSNVAVRLLDAGLATTLVVPPNSWSVDCYQQHENNARAARLGVWSLPAYQPQDSATLHRDTEGFRIVHGRVTGIRHTRYTVWVKLAGTFVARVSTKDLPNFKPGYFDTLTGKNVEVRGWIKDSHDGLTVNVRHPAALRVLATVASPRPD